RPAPDAQQRRQLLPPYPGECAPARIRMLADLRRLHGRIAFDPPLPRSVMDLVRSVHRKWLGVLYPVRRVLVAVTGASDAFRRHRGALAQTKALRPGVK